MHFLGNREKNTEKTWISLNFILIYKNLCGIIISIKGAYSSRLRGSWSVPTLPDLDNANGGTYNVSCSCAGWCSCFLLENATYKLARKVTNI